MEKVRNKTKTSNIAEEIGNIEEINSFSYQNLMLPKRLFLYGLLVWLVSLSACDSNRIYEKNIDIASTKWHKDSVLVFEFPINDTLSRYNIYYNVRNTLSYPFYNMYVTYYITDTLGKTSTAVTNSQGKDVSSDLQTFNLLHPKTGKPYGDGLGDIFSHSLLAIKNIKIAKKGKYLFKLKHYMRRNPLPEVVSMGIRIEKVPPLK